MDDECWKVPRPSDGSWSDVDDCKTSERWVPGSESSSVVCEAIACLVVACWPEEKSSWKLVDDNKITNRWTPGSESSSISCVAISCFAVACWPYESPTWESISEGAKCIENFGSATDLGYDSGFK